MRLRAGTSAGTNIQRTSTESNFLANYYKDKINLSGFICSLHSVNISSADIPNLISKKEKRALPFNFADIPCHPQTVERIVKLVT